jgi:hypothetical protein
MDFIIVKYSISVNTLPSRCGQHDIDHHSSITHHQVLRPCFRKEIRKPHIIKILFPCLCDLVQVPSSSWSQTNKIGRRKLKEINLCSSTTRKLGIRALYFRFNWRLCIWETEREKGRNTREISTVKRPWGPCIHTYICLFFTTNEFSLLNGPPLASYRLDGQKWHLPCQISADCK